MKDFPDTRASLITRIQDPGNSEAWTEFEEIYRPVIFRIARAKGLQYADAIELVQTVMVSVSAAIPKYESRENGPPFRNWLSRITRNAILKALSRKPQDLAQGGTGVLEVLSEIPSADPATEQLIQMEYEREVFRRAAEQVRSEVNPPTWLAFEMTVIQGHSIEPAAQRLNMSVGNVYAARARVVKRLKAAVQRLETTNPEIDVDGKCDDESSETL